MQRLPPLIAGLWACGTALAQTNEKPAAPAPISLPAPPAAAASAPQQRIEINANRESDTEQRRRFTAAKIVVGREEIDKFGDATLGEVLRRLPGVSTPGAPGRGGPPRMRGLGNGFTQLLIDGQPVPRGFSMESITPEQVERIEILRAPTAETGARAIAGSINIITREGYKKRINDLRLGVGIEHGQLSPGINWTHNDSVGALTYNVSGSAFSRRSVDESKTRTTVENADSGALLEDRSSHARTEGRRQGLNLTTRLQWRLGTTGDSLMLQPQFFHAESRSDTLFDLTKTLRRTGIPPFYDNGHTAADGSFTNARLTGQWRQRFGPVRLEADGGGGSFRSNSNSLRLEFTDGMAARSRELSDASDSRQNTLNLKLKGSMLVGGDDALPGSEQTLVSGLELESIDRSETRTTLLNDKSLFAGLGDNLKASVLRSAAYAQDEWTINPHWSAYAGLRWEGIETQGDTADGARPVNRSSVWTPLLHAVWKPDPKGRDQVRFSLTRSYRSPTLSALLGRPSVNREYPLNAINIRSAPDSVGNPNLKPELATGIDIALERYLEGGGVLSANLFHRNIRDLIRGVTELEQTVSYTTVPRFVRQQRNIGDATTAGIELEAKFRLDQLIAAAPRVEVRSNLSVYDSRVKSVPGPDNRLDQQARATANLGADYRLRGLPLTLGGSVNWVPGYTTREDVDQTLSVSRKTIWDMYALWTVSPTVGLRLLGNNLVARDYSTTQADLAPGPSGNERSTVTSRGPSYVNMQLRLELKI